MIIAISDIHLGYEKSNSESLLRFLDDCAGVEIEHFVILGDLMDFWRNNISQVAIDSQYILHRIGTLNARHIHYIPGNHDFFIHRLAERYPERYPFEVSNKLTLDDGGGQVTFVHGHELEVLANLEPITIEYYERLSERMCFTERITGGIASYLWDLVENRSEIIEKVGFIKKPPHERDSFDKVQDLATSMGVYVLLGMGPYDKLVYGHTHRPFINTAKTVANTGSWVDEGPDNRPRNTYVRIIDGQMELREFGRDTFP